LRLHFQSLGRGEPLVVLHGLFGSGDNWHGFAQRFATRFRVFLPDARNHGLSPHDREMSYALMAEDVSEMMAEQGIGPAHMLGHSMGGKTAMQLALSEGKLVRSLVVVDIAPRAYAPCHEHILEALCALELAHYRDRRQIEEALAQAVPDLIVRRFLLKSLSRDASGGFRWKLGLEEIRENYPRLNEALAGGRAWNGSCLFVRGGDSDYVSEDDQSAIRGLFPAARFEAIPGAGHWVHADAPDQFEALVGSFLT
jgi:pimeloyl-ACP methyl ester carboxylesterase